MSKNEERAYQALGFALPVVCLLVDITEWAENNLSESDGDTNSISSLNNLIIGEVKDMFPREELSDQDIREIVEVWKMEAGN
jgi:hypothetical protein